DPRQLSGVVEAMVPRHRLEPIAADEDQATVSQVGGDEARAGEEEGGGAGAARLLAGQAVDLAERAHEGRLGGQARAKRLEEDAVEALGGHVDDPRPAVPIVDADEEPLRLQRHDVAVLHLGPAALTGDHPDGAGAAGRLGHGAPPTARPPLTARPPPPAG